MKCAFLGLGVMGFPMAGHLATAGNEVTVYNRTKSKSEEWKTRYSGRSSKTIAHAVENAEIVFSCVGNDLDSFSVAEEAILNMQENSIYVDHTTTSAECAEKILALATKNNIRFIDAPVSGGEAGAVNGALSVMCGAEESTLDLVRQAIETYAKRIVHIGPPGHGQLCKAVNQIAIAGLLQGLSEAVHFAKSTNLDTDKVLEAISGGAAQSWQMENRWSTMVRGEFAFGFAVEWMRKDLAIVFKEAKRAGVILPVTELVDSYYAEVAESGGSRSDTSSLVTLFEKD